MTLYGGLLDQARARFTRFGKSTQLIDKASKKSTFKNKTAHLTTFKHFFFFIKKKKTLDLPANKSLLKMTAGITAKRLNIYQAEIDSSA